MSLNPVFGQGMTVSLMQAQMLDKMIMTGMSTMDYMKKCEEMSKLPFHLSRLGSEKKGIGKLLLRAYLKCCQKSHKLHHLFLRQLHTLKLLPGSLT